MRVAVRTLVMALALAAANAFPQSPAAAPTPEQERLRAIYRELVEINTTDSSGSCTEAAEAMAKRLRAAGFPASDLRVIAPPGAPKKGNLVARLRGTGARKPLLLLAHLDVVEAKREDWKRDPFKLVEEGGYFHARGASDDKAMASAFVANFIRYREEGFRPARDIVLALTCDEEIIPSRWNGVEHLLKHHRELIDAEFALNEGGGGVLDKSGQRVRINIQAGEKVFQSYRLEVTNPGGHSAQPRKDKRFLNSAGIPTYGISGMFNDPATSGVHGLNERIPVRSLYEGQEFLYRLVKLWADAQ